MKRQLSLFEDQRLRLEDSIELSIASLCEYGSRYPHWALAYSGGKDSSATVAFVAWAIHSGLVPRPESLSVLYADTRMELPPLQQTAVQLLSQLRLDGFRAEVVLPPIDKRFYVYNLGKKQSNKSAPTPNNKKMSLEGRIGQGYRQGIARARSRASVPPRYILPHGTAPCVAKRMTGKRNKKARLPPLLPGSADFK